MHFSDYAERPNPSNPRYDKLEGFVDKAAPVAGTLLLAGHVYAVINYWNDPTLAGRLTGFFIDAPCVIGSFICLTKAAFEEAGESAVRLIDGIIGFAGAPSRVFKAFFKERKSGIYLVSSGMKMLEICTKNFAELLNAEELVPKALAGQKQVEKA
jgi:hypothetical protein